MSRFRASLNRFGSGPELQANERSRQFALFQWSSYLADSTVNLFSLKTADKCETASAICADFELDFQLSSFEKLRTAKFSFRPDGHCVRVPFSWLEIQA